jgi:hypothetical protein
MSEMMDFHEMVTGPGHLRFFIQPAIAILLGARDGLKDHKLGLPPYLFSIVHQSTSRGRRLAEGARSIGVPLIFAVAAAYLFQHLILGRIVLLAGFLYALVFVALPYVLSRSLSNRAARLGRSRKLQHP